MNYTLVINSSVRTDHSHSRQLTERMLERILINRGDSTIVHRDLAGNTLPHFSHHTFSGFRGGESEEASAASALSLSLIEEVKNCHTLVIGTPVYNFSIPSTLKAWIDHIARAGVTFNYTENGPVGSLQGRKVYIVVTSGGGNIQPLQAQLTDTFSLMGMDDITFIHGANLDIPGKEAALSAVYQQINAL